MTEEEKKTYSVSARYEKVKDLYLTNIIESIPGQYRNEENDIFFKLFLEQKLALFGFEYMLYVPAQEGDVLKIVANMIFNIKDTLKIKLNDDEIKFLANFCFKIAGIDANNYYDFNEKMKDAFDGDVSIYIDEDNDIVNFFFKEDKKSILKTIVRLGLFPLITGMNSKIFFLKKRPVTKFCDFNISPDKQYDGINFDKLNIFGEEACSYLIDYNNILFINSI